MLDSTLLTIQFFRLCKAQTIEKVNIAWLKISTGWRQTSLYYSQARTRSWSRDYQEQHQLSEWDLNLQPLHFKSAALTTQPRCLLPSPSAYI